MSNGIMGPPTDLAGTGVPGLEFIDVTATPKTKAEIQAALSGGFDLGDAIGGLLSGVTSNLGTIGSGIGGMAAINAAYDRLGSVGERALTGANLIAGQGLEQTQFKPFTVTTGMGDQIGITDTGLNIDLGRGRNVSNELLSTASRRLDEMGPGTAATDAAMQQAFGVGSDFMGRLGQTDTAREQEIFDRIRATQLGEEERQRLALEERLANQGRLGVRTSMFGGTPEQFALAQAQEEAQNRASLAAIQQAQQEQRQQAAIGSQFAGLGSSLAGRQQAIEEAQQRMALGALTGAFVPQAQALNVAQQGLNAAQLAQRSQLAGAGLFGEASMSGLEALLGSALGQANLMGNVGTGLLSGAIQGSGSGQDGLLQILGTSVADPLGDLIGSGISSIGRAFGFGGG
jgi:hypothetical protein